MVQGDGRGKNSPVPSSLFKSSRRKSVRIGKGNFTTRPDFILLLSHRVSLLSVESERNFWSRLKCEFINKFCSSQR